MTAAPADEKEEDRLLRHIRAATVGLLVISSVGAAYFARDFLLPVVFAFLIAFTLRPYVRSMSRRGIPAWATTAVFVVIAAALLAIAIWAFAGSILDWIDTAPQIQRNFLQKMGSLRGYLDHIITIGRSLETVASPAKDPGVQEVVVRQPLLPTIWGFVATYPVSVIFVASGAVIIAIFLMGSGDLFYEKLIRVLPTLSDKKAALSMALDIEREVSTYLSSITFINAGLAVAVGLAFWAIGMPTPHLWALLAFILNFIPYLGPIAGLALSLLIGVVSFDTLGAALLAPAIYGLLIGIESQIVTPHVLSRRMRVNAVMILLSLAFWAWLWGIAGIVVAVPLLVTFRVLCSHIEALAGFGEFLSHRHEHMVDAPQAEDQPGS